MSFKNLKANKRAKFKDLPQVPREVLYMRPDFNVRERDEEYEQWLQDGVDFLKAGGKFPPLETYWNDDGMLEVVDGHGRLEIIDLAAKQGHKIELIDVLPFVGNDVKRKARIGTSNKYRPLKPTEYARLCSDLRAMNLDVGEIALELGVSRTTIDKALALADANKDVQDLVKSGAVSATLAVATVKKNKGKAGEVLKKALTSAKAAGKGKATAKDVSGPKAPKKPSAAAILQLLKDVDSLLERKLAEEGATDTLEITTLRKGIGAMVKGMEA